MPHKPKLPRSRCFYPAFNQSWAIHHVHIVLNNSETMLVSLVLHFNGKKKKNHMLIVQASQSCLASFRYSVFFHVVIIFFVKIR